MFCFWGFFFCCLCSFIFKFFLDMFIFWLGFFFIVYFRFVSFVRCRWRGRGWFWFFFKMLEYEGNIVECIFFCISG